MKTLEVFEKLRPDHSLNLQDSAELSELEALLQKKNGRLYFRCPVRKKDILAKPEEAVRQLWIPAAYNSIWVPSNSTCGRIPNYLRTGYFETSRHCRPRR